VRRTTVTLAVGRLEVADALACRRGYVEIRSREELERRSCECYGHAKRHIARLFSHTIEGGLATMSPENSVMSAV